MDVPIIGGGSAGNVPIIGQINLRGWYPKAIANCACDEKYPLVLENFGTPTQCPCCGRAYAIHSMMVDRESGQIGVRVVELHITKNDRAGKLPDA